VTGLIGLNLDEVVRRAEIARRHRNRVLTGLVLVLLALSVLAGGGGFSAYWYRSLNAQNQDRTVEWAHNENKKIEDQKLRGDATVETLLSSLSGLEKLVNDNGGNTSKGRYVKAQILIILASAYQTLGKTDESLAHAQNASKILIALLAEQSQEFGWAKYLATWYENLTGVVRPSQPDLQNQLSIAYQKIGDSLLYRDRLAVARDWYSKSLDLAQLLETTDPNNAEWQRGLSRAYDKIGDASKAFGNLAGARTNYEKSLAIRIRLAERDPKPQAQRDLASVYDRLAEILRLQDKLAEALELEQRSRGIVASFLTADAGNNDWRRNLALNDRKLADIHRDMGELSVALAGYDESFAIIKQLNARDPKNTEWRGDVADWYVVIGDLRGKQGELGKAEENFRSAVTVLEELARSDSNNTQWQRALAQAYDRLATMLGRQAYAAARSPGFNLPAAGTGTSSSSTGIFTETLLYYAKSLEIRQTLAAKDPENLTWQSELGASHANLATVRWTQGQLAQDLAEFELAADMFRQARKEFEFARDMFQQVCMAEPDNINWQRDLASANRWLARFDKSPDDEASSRRAAERTREPDPVASEASLPADDGR
jgi:tetratricopeptide (TPR) repeat protein